MCPQITPCGHVFSCHAIVQVRGATLRDEVACGANRAHQPRSDDLAWMFSSCVYWTIVPVFSLTLGRLVSMQHMGGINEGPATFRCPLCFSLIKKLDLRSASIRRVAAFQVRPLRATELAIDMVCIHSVRVPPIQCLFSKLVSSCAGGQGHAHGETLPISSQRGRI